MAAGTSESWEREEDWRIPGDRPEAQEDPWVIDADDWPPASDGDDNRFPYPAGLP